MVTLKSFSSLKASKNIVSDAELSFRQMSMAKNVFIPLMSKYKWTDKAIHTFAQFWTQLKVHLFQQQEYGERVLLVYQAHIHREWHNQLKLGKGFNISAMNKDLLQSIYREILDKAQLNSINEVSKILVFSLIIHLIIKLFLITLLIYKPIRNCIIHIHFTLCHWHHASCFTHNTPCNMQHATCNTQHATPIIHHKSCDA